MGKISVNTDIDINYAGVLEHLYPLNLTLSEFRKLFVFLPQVLDFSCAATTYGRRSVGSLSGPYLLDRRCIMKRFTFIMMLLSTLIILSGCILVLKCINFEGFAFGATYHFGDTLWESATKMTLKEFYWSNGTPTNNGNLKVDNKGLAGHTGLDVNLNNITVAFTFPSAPTGLILYYGEYGGNINVEVNGDLKNVQNFADINGAVIGGVNVSITNVVGQKGVLNLLGTINSFSIGGQELWIDHVCPRK